MNNAPINLNFENKTYDNYEENYIIIRIFGEIKKIMKKF